MAHEGLLSKFFSVQLTQKLFSVFLCVCVQVWRPRVAAQCHSESVLMVDVHRGHLTDEFRGSLTSMSTDIVFIPSGCSCRLQPLDVCVTPVLRDFLQVLSPISPVSPVWTRLTCLCQ